MESLWKFFESNPLVAIIIIAAIYYTIKNICRAFGRNPEAFEEDEF